MAIFGFHFVVTLIAAAIYNKLTSRVSFSKWLIFRGHEFYLLRSSLLPPIQTENHKQARKRKQREVDNRLRDDTLISCPLTLETLEGTPFIGNLQWSTNFFVFAIIVYSISEFFSFLFPENRERNTSLIWILLLFVFLFYILGKLTAVKMYSEALYPERNMIICFSAIFFFIAMSFVMFSDAFMDIGFLKGYVNLTKSLNAYLNGQGLANVFDTVERSPVVLLVVLSAMFTIIASTVLFPSFQYASFYLAAMQEASSFNKVILHGTFFLPILLFMSFSISLKEHILVTGNLSNEQYESIQILGVIFWTALRCATAKIHLQTFLDLPKIKIYDLAEKKLEERQRRITYYASYFCAAALQYFVPVLLIFSSALLLKSLGNVSISSLWTKDGTTELPLKKSPLAAGPTIPINLLLGEEIHRPIWTLFLVSLLGINASLSLFGVVLKRSIVA